MAAEDLRDFGLAVAAFRALLRLRVRLCPVASIESLRAQLLAEVVVAIDEEVLTSEPLVAVADAAGGHWPTRARRTAGRVDMKNLSPHVIWAGVTVVVLVVVAVTVLAALGKDTTALLAVVNLAALPILAAFGAVLNGKVEQVRDASNGNLDRLLSILAETHPGIHSSGDDDA